MELGREVIEGKFDELWEYINSDSWLEWSELFAEKCSFINSLLDAPIESRSELSKVAVTWGVLENRPNWSVIDGNRLVVGWSERLGKDSGDTPWYTGVSMFLFDDQGLIQAYEGTFDVKSAMDSWNYNDS